MKAPLSILRLPNIYGKWAKNNYNSAVATFCHNISRNKKIYISFDKLINSLNLDNWIFVYIFFELNLIKSLGYDVNLNQYKNITDGFSEIKKRGKFTCSCYRFK